MGYYISSLIKGMDHMEELALWIDSKPFPNLGVELIAFTHDKGYWLRLGRLLKKLHCPISFHGPYIGVEATAPKGTPEHAWMLESYDRVFAYAKEYEVKHVVFHYTQKSFDELTIQNAKKNSIENILELHKLAEKYKVNMLIENIAFPKSGLPLYNNQEYSDLLSSIPGALSIIDIGHAHINKMNIEQVLKKHGNNVKAYHLHNNDGKLDQHNSIMNGTYDYNKFFPLYKKYTPEADIILEYEPHTNLSKEELINQLQYLSEMLQ